MAAKGNLHELLTKSGENQTFEINVKGASAESLSAELGAVSGATLTAKPNGANIQVLSEDDIEKVLPLIKKANGKLVSVQPVKLSLEEFFVEETV